MISLDTLKHIVSFLDWTCDMETCDTITRIFKLNQNEKIMIKDYWHTCTKFVVEQNGISIIRYVNGKLHCDDGPAIETWEFKEWWKNDLRHRVDGPAIKWRRGIYNMWFLNGLLHRLDGPAVELDDNYCEWWAYGVRHRLNGPAIVCREYGERWEYGKKIHKCVLL